MINDFSIAKKCFEKTVQLNNDMYLAYYRLGQIALLYRDFDSAEENFAKSSYNEKEAKAYFELAKIHILKNQKEKAVLDLNNSIKVDTSYYEVARKEPILFPIKQYIVKPQNEVKNEYEETEQEKEIEAYLKDTYNLTKILNRQKETKSGIPKKEQE
jgi:tetratricopeptide (TPR) repeat protein